MWSPWVALPAHGDQPKDDARYRVPLDFGWKAAGTSDWAASTSRQSPYRGQQPPQRCLNLRGGSVKFAEGPGSVSELSLP